MLKLLIGGLAVLLAVWIGAGFAVVALSGRFEPSGRFVDIGGRKLRLVCDGPKSDKPVVWMEAGSWGLAADFAAIQQGLTAKGVRSCAYDRAGMGFSDPGPGPRNSAAIAADLAKLAEASGERGPFILMAHSMGGQHIRLFAGQHPDQVAGLVLLEATTPEMTSDPRAQLPLRTARHRRRRSWPDPRHLGHRIGLHCCQAENVTFVSGRCAHRCGRGPRLGLGSIQAGR